MTIVIDVQSDPNFGQVLEESIGKAFKIYMLSEVENHVQLTLGGMYLIVGCEIKCTRIIQPN